ncbi:MAG: response regulator [Acidobacteria bacterium]|nr:response regulator [Acidobacteriota bacterium]
MLDDIPGLFEPSLSGKPVRLSIEIDPALPNFILGDSVRLRQILVNILGNAVKFTHQGEIRFSASAIDNRLRFEISDTGIGIPPSELSSIFEAFTQVHHSDTKLYGSTGLGLSIANQLAQLMGNSISASSQLAKGSTFIVEIPFSPASAPPTTTKAPQISAKLTGRRILLAKDNPTNQRLFTVLLQKQGCLVQVAENGTQAIEMFTTAQFDIVLMDVQMPIMDGLEATRILRSQSQVPILGLTAHASESDQQACITAGMNAVLTKPVDTQRLFSHIQQLVTNKS